MIAVSLAWGARYRAHVAAWRESVEAAGMLPRVLELSDEPAARREAWPLRPSMIAQALEESGGEVLHLDIDARILSAPTWPAGCDLAAYTARPGVTLEPGVSFWRPTEYSYRTLAAWGRILEEGAPDDFALGAAAEEQKANVSILPPELCWVEAWGMRERYGDRKPVIRVLAGSRGGA